MTNFLLALLFVFSQSSPAQLRQIYDGRTIPPPSAQKRVTAADQTIFKQKILGAARRQWREQASKCDKESGDNYQIIDVASGKFTNPLATQRAILYRFCTYGHNFAYNGIAITEPDRGVVAHVVYDGAWDNAIYALPDLNGNGLSEIMLSIGGTNMGETWGVISILEFTDMGFTALGSTETMSDRCGVSESESGDAYVIFGRPGRNPAFFRESFNESCRKNAHWRKTKALEQVTLDPNEVEYKRLL